MYAWFLVSEGLPMFVVVAAKTDAEAQALACEAAVGLYTDHRIGQVQLKELLDRILNELAQTTSFWNTSVAGVIE